MKIFIQIGICLLSTICLAQEPSKDRIIYYDESIETNEYDIPLSSTTWYFPKSFMPGWRSTSEPIDSTSKLIRSSYEIINEEDNSLTVVPAKYWTSDISTPNTIYLDWFSEQLRNLEEPLLYNKPTDKITYRFTWLRSFHHPISIRLEAIDNEIWIYTKVGKGAGGYSPEGIKKSKRKRVSMKNYRTLLHLLEKLDFWKVQNQATIPGSDGSKWILEGSTLELYSMCYKSNRVNISSFNEVCYHLMKISGLRIKKKNLY